MPEQRWWAAPRHQKWLGLTVVMALLGTMLSVVLPPTTAAAVGTVLFDNTFNDRTVDGTGTVTVPTPFSGTNAACLSASGNTATGPLLSCASNTDAQGSGKLRLTAAATNQVGGVFGAASFPTSNGLDVTFNSYQYGGGGSTNGDGMSFVLAAINPANPASPTTMGQSGGSLGYSPAGTVRGLPNAYLGVGLDVFGNFSSKSYQGTGCTDTTNITTQQPGSVVVRGPGNVLAGYCGLTTTSDGTAATKLTLRATTRAAAVVPVQVLINPTAAAFTSTTGVVVAAGAYKVVVTPVGGTAKTLTGTLPAAPTTLYPSASWVNASGVPKQLAFGFIGSTGSVFDAHEASNVKVITFNQVPQLSVATTTYAVAAPDPGAPVNYVLNASVQSGAAVTKPISVTQTTPAGVVPLAAFGTGWVCAAPVGQTIGCTTTASSFASGAALPAVNVVAIVTGSGVTSAIVQSSSPTTVSSADSNPGAGLTTTAGTVPAAPTGVAVSPTSGPVAGGNMVTYTGTSSTGPTAYEIGTLAELQAGTPVTLLECATGVTANCWAVSGPSVLVYMPARSSAGPVLVTSVTLGVAGSTTYTYTDRPATPAAPTATAGTTSATVSWVAPANNSSAITGYTVTPYKAGVAQTAVVYNTAATTQTLNGLTAGARYTFTVAATNGIGTSAASAQSAAVTPYALPGTPTIGTVAAGDSLVTVNWSAPASNGSAITGYVVTPYIGTTAQTAQTFNSAATSQDVTGLTPGTAYTFAVAAVNAAGTGPASGKSTAATPNDSPTLTFAAPPDGRIGVAYSTQLAATGGTSPFTWSVSVGSLPPGLTLGASTGLLSGTPTTSGSYAFTVKVVDASAQNATRSVTIVVTGAAAAPATPTASAGVTSATVSWATPASNGSPITGYVVTPYQAGVAQTAVAYDTAATTQTLTGLTAGTSYTFTVAAVNGVGTSAGSAQSNAVTPYALAGAPTISGATAGDSQVTLTWSAPANNGSAITGYIVIPYIGTTAQPAQTFDSTATSQDVVGLTAGTAYTFTVAAQNAAGTGPASAASPAATPNASPTLAFPPPPDGRLSVAYSNPLVVTGGTSPFAWTVTVGTLPTGLTLAPSTGLLSGTPTALGSFTFTVKVTDANAQTATQSVTMAITDRPTAPATPTATAGISSATLTWVAPAGNGSAITGYVVTPYLAGTAQTPVVFDSTATTQTLTGLTAGSSYRFTVAAVNATGTSVASGQSVAVVPYAVATAPGTPTVTAGDSQVTLTWTTPASSNGAPITGYTVTPFIGATAQTPVVFGSITLTQTITGLTPGTAYTFTVAAVNAAGPGPASASSAPVTPNAFPTLAFPPPPAGQVAIAYSNQLAVTGGTAPFTWSVSSGTLPPGLTLGAATGLLAGTPTAGGSYPFTVRITDANNQSSTQSVTVAVTAAPIVTFAPAAGEVGVAYSQQPTVSGGTGPYVWTIAAGSLPAGVTIDASTGLVGGTPTASGTFSVTIRATDAVGQAASRTASVVIAAAPTLPSLPTPGKAGVAYSFTFAATGGTGPFTYAVVAGALPAGLSLSSAGVLSGTPPSVGSASFTVRVVDSFGQTANDAVTLVIAAAPISVVNSTNVASVAPGGTVTFTVTATNSSSTAYNGVTINSPLSSVLDDATFSGTASASSGVTSYAGTILQWDVNLPAGATETMTYSVVVANPDAGNLVLSVLVNTSGASTTCNPGNQDSACTATVNVSGMTIVKSADVTTTTPGNVVHFRIVLKNTGKAVISGMTVTESLAGMLDDATYDGNAASVGAGAVSYANSTISWLGNLAVGATATITYSVTVANPDTGNHSLTATVVSAAAGSPCPSGNPAASCSAPVSVLIPALVITNTAGTGTATPGSVVPYTITVSNTGQTAYTGISVTVGLAAALDDAVYTSSSATAGNVVFNAGTGGLVWTGDVAIGDSVTISAAVTIRDPDPADKVLTSVATSTAAGNTCPVGGSNTACTATVQVLVPGLTITKSANVATTTPGSVVTYTILVTNTGQTPYNGASFSDPLTAVLDDASFGTATTTAGVVSYNAPTLTWTGDLAVGASATTSYSVTVRRPDPGDRTLTNTVTSATPGSNCASGSTDVGCTSTVPVLIPGLSVSTSADVGTTTPGGVVRYSINVTNTGQSTYTGIAINLGFNGVVDDADYNLDGTTSTGSLVNNPDGSTAWVLSLAPGESATGTTSFTVNNPDTGDRSLVSAVSSSAAGSSCPITPANPACIVTVGVLLPGLTMTKSANTASVTPGDPITYTISVVNSGQTSYPAAHLSDDLTRVLTDATYGGGATATVGTVSFDGTVLSWTGALSSGSSATISYTVTVRDPDPGDKQLTNTVVSDSAGSNCPAGGTDSRCSSSVAVLVPGLTITKTASAATTAPGATAGYTIKVTNTGSTAATGAAFADPLSGVLDDATLTSGPAATAGTASYANATVSWTGDLAIGATATITYSVTVNQADVGDDLLTNTITSTSRGTNCPAGGTDSRCSVTVPVARLIITETYDEATGTPGSVLHGRGSFVNTGQVAYTNIKIFLAGADATDDVLNNGDQTVSSGTLVIAPPNSYWTGDIPIGGVVTGSGTLTVRDPDTGNKAVVSQVSSDAPGSNCAPGSLDTRCTARATVLTPALTITKTADTSTAVPGQTVGYTLAIRNSGETPYGAARVVDTLSGALDDAVYNANAVATTGSLSYDAPSLTWTGALAVGQTVTITYSITVSNPDGGDHALVNTVNSSEVGSNCAPASADPGCRSSLNVLTPALTIVKTADLGNATLGTTVNYSIVVTNSGQTDYPAAAFSDALGGVLDDATYAGGAAASRGTVGYASGVLSWSGALAAGQSATITYSVQIKNPDAGDRTMTNTVVSTNDGNNCATGSTDVRCAAIVTVTNSVTLTFTKEADVDTTVPGAIVRYTVTATNSSALPVDAANFTDPLADIADDATYNNDAAATAGTVLHSGPNLVWTGTVAAHSTVQVTYSATVHSGITGDQILTGTVSSSTVVSSQNCAAGSTDPRCTSTVPVARLDLVQTAAESSATPGSVLHLTAVYTNTGMVPYTGISVASPREDTSEDTIPTGDQVASSGTLVRDADNITWTGDIGVGGSVRITRTLVVKSPDPGNHLITATLTSAAPGSNCGAGTTDGRCTFSVPVLTPALTVSIASDAFYSTPGGTVHYTITIHNTGETPYVGATVADNQAGQVDDAGYNADAAATTGALAYANSTLTWSGDLAVAATAIVTFSVTTHRPPDGDKIMLSALTSSDVGSTCPPASGNAACRSTVLILTPGLTITSTADRQTTVPGAQVSYTVTVANTGQTPYSPASFTAPLGRILDDATYAGGASASTGTVSVSGGNLSWTGALAPGATASISYVVIVQSPVTGNFRLDQTVVSADQGSNCPIGGTDPRCATSVPVAGLHILSTADVAAAKPTDVVHYTSAFTNTGQVNYVGTTISIDVLDAADDADYNGDATATTGSVNIVAGAPQISWTGDLPVGATVFLTASVTVKNPDPGNKVLSTVDSTTAAGTNCPSGSTDPACRNVVTVLTPGLSISQSSDMASTTPGGVVHYTITATNTGQTAYSATVVTDDLSDVLSEAAYTGPAVATSGTLGVANQTLTWTGDLAVGAAVTITFSVTVNDPDLGDKSIGNQVVSSELGSSCPAKSTDDACRTVVAVLIPNLSIAIGADQTTTTPGNLVRYTVTIANQGQTAYTNATVAVWMAGALDDATYAGGASTTAGALDYTSPTLTWTGDLAVGQTAIVSYAVTVRSPDPGNRALTTSVSSVAAGGTCTTATPCVNTVTVLIPGLAVSTIADVATATPGDRVTYTITVANTGQTAYDSTTVTTSLAGVVDDATFDGLLTASSGVAGYAAPNLSWTGGLPVGASATIVYSVVIRNPDPGDKTLSTTVLDQSAGSTCSDAQTTPSCTATVTVLVPSLSISKSASVASTIPGSVVGYTLTIMNNGQTNYTAASVSDSFVDVLKDATYNGDARVGGGGGGSVSYSNPTLTWTGNLLIGASVTVTYSITVKRPDPGDKQIVNSVTSSAPGSSCPVGGTLPACSTTVTVLVPKLTVTKTVDTTTVVAGGAVHYTVTVKNAGETTFAPATFTDPLTGVLDDAVYPGDAVTDVGTISYANNTLAWSGTLGPGAVATISYSVVTSFPALGDHTLSNTVLSSTQGSNCVLGTAAACRAAVTELIPALTISKTVDTTRVVAGGTVHYTLLATNTGAADYPAASLTDSLAAVLDEGTYNSDASSSTGTLSYVDDTLSWTGALDRGSTETITFSVTIDPDVTGDASLDNRVVSTTVGSTCPPNSPNPSCVVATGVEATTLTLSDLTPSFSLSGLPGSTVALTDAVGMTVTTNSFGGYTVTVGGTDDLRSTSGNPDTIPLGNLSVRETGTTSYQPLGVGQAVTVHRQNNPSGPAGDAVSNDFQVQIPDVAADTYTTDLEYIVTTQ